VETTQQQKSQILKLCWRSAAQEDITPEGRQGHAWVHHNDSLYIFGGRIADTRSGDKKNNRTYQDDLWRYNYDENSWTVIKGKGDIPSARHNHTAIVWDEKIWIVGGANEQGIYSDLYTFDIKECLWQKVVNTKGAIPPHHGHSATLYQPSNDTTPKMIIFGGGCWNNNERVYMNNVYTYDLLCNSWECLPAKGSIPCGRSFHSTILYEDSLVVFGGWWMTGDGKKRKEYYTNDLLQYSLQTNTWKHIPVSGNTPGPRNRQSCVKIWEDQEANKVVYLVFGGNYYDQKNRRGYFYNTAYSMDLFGPEQDLSAHWTPIPTEAMRGKVPMVSHHHAVFYDGKMYVGMGEAKRVKFNSTYVVDFIYSKE